ncbi:MAG: hydrolase, partial [Actinomycetia bacterium]|nr:hydrolase [Actinomycetes bacterium]
MISVLTNSSFRSGTADRPLGVRFTAAAALLIGCAVTAGCAGTAGHAAKQAGAVSPQIITLPPDAAPSDMITATDGSLWVTEGSIGAVAEISPAGHVTQFRIPGSSNDPDGILQEGTGGQIVYVGFEQIGYVTPGRPITGYEDGQGVNPGLPVAIAVGPDGEIWYTNGMGSNPRISRVNGYEGPATVTELP